MSMILLVSMPTFLLPSVPLLLIQADSVLVPYNLKSFANKMLDAATSFRSGPNWIHLQQQNISMEALQESINDFARAAKNFSNRHNKTNVYNPVHLTLKKP